MSEKIFVATEDFPLASELLNKKLDDRFDILTIDKNRPLKEQVGDVKVIIPAMEEINGEVMDNAQDLELIVQFGVGLEGVDIEEAEKRGIKVRNTPGKNAESVAECSLFLMLSLARNLNEMKTSFEKENIGTPIGNELKDKNLCVVGLGASGSYLAKIADGIGMNCRGVRKHPEKGGPPQIEKVVSPDNMDRLLKWADFVALHLPLTEETKNMFDEKKFEVMKSTSHIINVSRGGIIDKDALYKAIMHGKIAGAGLDVYWEEPADPNDDLYSFDSVITTPHIAGVTEEAYERLADEVVEIIENLID